MNQTNKVNIFYLINERLLPKLPLKFQLPKLSYMAYEYFAVKLRYNVFISGQRQCLFQLRLDFPDLQLLIFI